MDDTTETNVVPSTILKQRIVIDLMYAFCGAVMIVVACVGNHFDLLLFAIGVGVTIVCVAAAFLNYSEHKKHSRTEMP